MKPTDASAPDAMVVRLSGTLTCGSEAERRLVLECLPEHVRLTRQEPGCISFDVIQSPDDPMVWMVDERFSSQEAFDDHQQRTRASVWGQRTRLIARDYRVVTEP